MKTVEDAVIHKNGIWDTSFDALICNTAGDVYTGFSSMSLMNLNTREWLFVCTRDQFKAKAREMGYPKPTITEEYTTEAPPVGWHGEVSRNTKSSSLWRECVVLPEGSAVVKVIRPNGSSEWVVWKIVKDLLRFRPLNHDRKQWVEQAIKIDTGTGAESYYLFAEALYDAMKEGTLPVPGGGK